MKINIKKLQIILVILVIVIVGLIFFMSKDDKEDIIENKKEEGNTLEGIDLENDYSFDNLDYNNLSNIEKEFVKRMYSDNVIFTDKGTEVYHESIYSGNLQKIITSKWPENEDIFNFIPKPEFGKLVKVEYADDWIKIYLNDVKERNVKDYFKQIKKLGFEENEEKDDGKVMLKYDIYDKNQNRVSIIYLKKNDDLTISFYKSK